MSPPEGRPYLIEEKAGDLVRRYTVLAANDLAAGDRALVRRGGGKALEVRDPDGHVLELRSK